MYRLLLKPTRYIKLIYRNIRKYTAYAPVVYHLNIQQYLTIATFKCMRNYFVLRSIVIPR